MDDPSFGTIDEVDWFLEGVLEDFASALPYNETSFPDSGDQELHFDCERDNILFVGGLEFAYDERTPFDHTGSSSLPQPLSPDPSIDNSSTGIKFLFPREDWFSLLSTPLGHSESVVEDHISTTLVSGEGTGQDQSRSSPAITPKQCQPPVKRHRFCTEAKAILLEWYNSHDYPYLSPEDLKILASKTGSSERQVRTFLTNRRARSDKQSEQYTL